MSSDRYEKLSHDEIGELIKLPSRLSILVYLILKRYCGDKDYCFPSQSLIAQELNCSRETVVRAIKLLEKSGFLIQEHGVHTSKFALARHKNVSHSHVSHSSDMVRQSDVEITVQSDVEITVGEQCDVQVTVESGETELKLVPPDAPDLSRIKLLNLGKKLVERVIEAKNYWPAGYATQAVKDRAARNVRTIISRGDVTAERLEEIATYYAWEDPEHHIQGEFPFKVTNLFGTKPENQRWREVEQWMIERAEAAESRSYYEHLGEISE